MQDKIQEIMGLVTQHAYIYYSAAIGGCRYADDVKESECAIESKLRELVREPLSDESILRIQEKYVGGVCQQYPLDESDWINFARAIENSHNITNTSG